MMRAFSKARGIIFLFVFCVIWGITPRPTFSATCSDGTGIPPFLSGEATINPNVLFMIDNSASMLDLAAVGAKGIC